MPVRFFCFYIERAFSQFTKGVVLLTKDAHSVFELDNKLVKKGECF
jgi:hypothetical protein